MNTFELRFPEGYSREHFLGEIWQKKPLLMRGALSDYRGPLGADELAGLACEESIESRIVLEQGETPWQLRRGPFTETDFAELPDDSPWTLLVQDVDKHLPEVGRLLTAFQFLPAWRIDDVMISFAVPGGSVGPHIDHYDVFLLQVQGRRRWRFGASPLIEPVYRADTELRILSEFEPDSDLVLEPGDILYLPPEVPHWGTALDDCLTCSVGFHAPSYPEMITDWCQQRLEQIDRDGHFRDPPITLGTPPGMISDAAFDAADRLLEELLNSNREDRRRWFGRLVTQTKPHLGIDPRESPLQAGSFPHQFEQRSPLQRHPYARLARADLDSRSTALFVNGQSFELPAVHRGFVIALIENRILHWRLLTEWLRYPDCVDLITRLYNDGYLSFHDETI